MSHALRKVLKRLHYPIGVMLVSVLWYAAYPLSLRNLEEMMAERGVVVDHTTVHRWSVKMMPVLALVLRQRKRPVGLSWRMDETYVKVGGQWKYLYRAVHKAEQTIDFLLRAHRDCAAARRFFERAINLHGLPEKITIDKSGANTAAIEGIRADSGAEIEMCQSKYLNNLIEQDHRAVKRIVRPMLGFKTFRCARALAAGIQTMHMIKKCQLDAINDRASSVANQFYSLAFWTPAALGLTRAAPAIATEPLVRSSAMDGARQPLGCRDAVVGVHFYCYLGANGATQGGHSFALQAIVDLRAFAPLPEHPGAVKRCQVLRHIGLGGVDLRQQLGDIALPVAHGADDPQPHRRRQQTEQLGG